MSASRPPIYLGTVLLEAQRWTADKRPSFKVSELAPAIAAAGFDGLELWENHAALADESERQALAQGPVPVRILNSYAGFAAAEQPAREQLLALAVRYGVTGVKFNFGREPARLPEYLASLGALLERLPPSCRLLCECHGNTVLEEPEIAARHLAPFQGRVGIIVHAFGGERARLAQWLACFGPAVAHVHVAGQRAGALCGLAGLGDEARARLALLRAAGFSGSWTIEFTAGVAQPPEDRRALLANATADLHWLRAALA